MLFTYEISWSKKDFVIVLRKALILVMALLWPFCHLYFFFNIKIVFFNHDMSELYVKQRELVL